MIARLAGLVAKFVVTVLVATIIVFVLLRVVPGDPAVVALGTDATPQALERWREAHDVGGSLVGQYFHWLGGFVTGDFGLSYVTAQDITSTVLDRLQVTLILCLLAIIVALIIALPLGTLAAVWQRNAGGAIISAVSQVGVAIPNFLVGVLLIAFFSISLGWVPAGGWAPPAEGGAFLRHVALPVIALGSVQASVLTRYVRSAVLEIMQEDFIRTGRSKGLTATGALIKHGLRNAGIPVLTVVGVQLATLLIGAVVIERVFAIPGLGSYLVDSVGNRDLLAVQAVVALLVVVIVLINFLVDLAYTLVDPRLRKAS
ncbi:MAG: ABC transporter permease [Galactobacter sp.]